MEKIGSTAIKFGSASEMESGLAVLRGHGMNGLHANAALTQEFTDEETRHTAYQMLADAAEDRPAIIEERIASLESDVEEFQKAVAQWRWVVKNDSRQEKIDDAEALVRVIAADLGYLAGKIANADRE